MGYIKGRLGFVVGRGGWVGWLRPMVAVYAEGRSGGILFIAGRGRISPTPPRPRPRMAVADTAADPAAAP